MAGAGAGAEAGARDRARARAGDRASAVLAVTAARIVSIATY